MIFETGRLKVRRKIIPGLLLLIAGLVGIAPRDVFAHPMGNFSVSHYAAINIERDNVELHYFVDMAEIPTYQEIQRTGIVAQEGDSSLASYLAHESVALSEGLLVEIDGQPIELRAIDHSVLFTPGAGGLPTMKLAFVYRAQIENNSPDAAHRVHYVDRNFAGHSGWKEIVITQGDGVALVSSSAPATDRSAQLSNYPTDLLNSPPQDLEAAAEFSQRPLAPAPMAASKGVTTPAMAPITGNVHRTLTSVTEKTASAPATKISGRSRTQR